MNLALNATDADITIILQKMLNQRHDSINQYTAVSRHDLADQEAYEVSVIQTYHPEQLNADIALQLVRAALVASEAKVQADIGKVMTTLKPKIQGRFADLSVVSQQVKTALLN